MSQTVLERRRGARACRGPARGLAAFLGMTPPWHCSIERPVGVSTLALATRVVRSMRT